MYTYVSAELPALVEKCFPVDPARKSLLGSSMGGGGVLTIAAKNSGSYKCVSAMAPVCSAFRKYWGKALSKYHGGDEEAAR